MEIIKKENEEVKPFTENYNNIRPWFVNLLAKFVTVEFGPLYKTFKNFPINYKVPNISRNDLKHGKKSFNYLLTQIIIPQLMLSDLDNFYENCMVRSVDMELFINNAIYIAAKFARNNSDDFESLFELEQLESLWVYTHTVGELVIITIPQAKNLYDCIQIAFSGDRYFTLEVADNQKLTLCEWVLEGDSLCHKNYGMIIMQKCFFRKIVEILKRKGFWLYSGYLKSKKNKNYFSVITHREEKLKLQYF